MYIFESRNFKAFFKFSYIFRLSRPLFYLVVVFLFLGASWRFRYHFYIFYITALFSTELQFNSENWKTLIDSLNSCLAFENKPNWFINIFTLASHFHLKFEFCLNFSCNSSNSPANLVVKLAPQTKANSNIDQMTRISRWLSNFTVLHVSWLLLHCFFFYILVSEFFVTQKNARKTRQEHKQTLLKCNWNENFIFEAKLRAEIEKQ